MKTWTAAGNGGSTARRSLRVDAARHGGVGAPTADRDATVVLEI